MLGMHGTAYANMAVAECDLIMSVGSRWDDRITGKLAAFCPNAVKIHVDIDPAEIGKMIKPHCAIVGDARLVLEELLPLARKGDTGEWISHLKKLKKRFPLHYRMHGGLKAQYVLDELFRLTKGKAIVTTDVGQHQMWAAQYYRFDKPRRWINSGGLGTMGVGLPYAMGIKKAFPESEVVTVTGEGSIQMCIQELSTCQQYDTPVKIISLNNRYLGMVRQWQELIYNNRYSHSYMDSLPDFVKLAEAYGHVGMRIEKKSDVEPALREAFKLKDRTVFMDFQTDPTENVWPMVQAGKGITDMLMGSEEL